MTKAIEVASVLAAVLALTGWQTAQAAEKGSKSEAAGSTDEARFIQLTHKITYASLKGDVSIFDDLYADDYLSISAVSNTPGTKADVINNFKSGKLKYQTLITSNIKVHSFGPTAVLVTGRTEAKGTLDGKDISGSYRTSRLWVKRDGKWQVVFFQSTTVPAEARAG